MFDRPLAGARARARSDANLNPGAARARELGAFREGNEV